MRNESFCRRRRNIHPVAALALVLLLGSIAMSSVPGTGLASGTSSVPGNSELTVASSTPNASLAVVSAIITMTKGRVEVSLSREKTWRTVGSGFPLAQGDRVRTGRDSWAEIKLLCGSSPRGWIRLEPESEFLLEATSIAASATSQVDFGPQVASKSGLSLVSRVAIRTRLFLGRMYVKILRQLSPVLVPTLDFEVTTDAATIGVRGTLFAVYVLPSRVTRVSVQEGLVEVAAEGRSVLLGPGQETTVYPGSPPESPGPASIGAGQMWQGAQGWLEEVEGDVEKIKGKIEDEIGGATKELEGLWDVPEELPKAGGEILGEGEGEGEGVLGGGPGEDGTDGKGNEGYGPIPGPVYEEKPDTVKGPIQIEDVVPL